MRGGGPSRPGKCLFPRALRWKILMRYQSFDVSFKASVKAFSMSLFFSMITPGRLGEFSKPLLLGYSDKASIARLSVSTVLDRLWDVSVIMMLGLPLLWTHQEALDINLRSVRGSAFALVAVLLAAEIPHGMLEYLPEFFDSGRPPTPRGAPADAASAGHLIYALTAKVEPRHYGGEDA